MSVRTFSDIKLPLGVKEETLLSIAQKKLGGNAKYFSIKKKSLDARDKNNIRYVYTIECSKEPQKEELAVIERLPSGKCPVKPVLVVGSGPAGLFCALRLLEHGIKPVLIERGAPVEEREKSIQRFFETRFLDTQSNIQFGEGGAGTFSDGKLNTQTHSPLNCEVLEIFVRFGAPKEILYLSKPHIGSDKLKQVVQNMRAYILEQGGEVHFYTQLEDIHMENGRLESVVLRRVQPVNADMVPPKPTNADFSRERIPVAAVILAVGHSARDTFEMLLKRGVPMQQKEFAVGVRIEHLQKNIGLAQYGSAYTKLPAAEYKLVSHASQRAAFTFCMCPGGFVMPSASEDGGVVTNGMSNYARDGENANSALIAQVTRADFSSDSPMAGIEFQRKIERAAFRVGGGDYSAPVQLVGDFLQDKPSARFGEVIPTYAAGTSFADFREVLPTPIIETLKTALTDMDRRLRGFAHPHAVLTAVESRTSSPVRIVRDETLQSVGVKGLYPCGEGAGYAGGITSSAADGLRVATAIYKTFAESR